MDVDEAAIALVRPLLESRFLLDYEDQFEAGKWVAGWPRLLGPLWEIETDLFDLCFLDGECSLYLNNEVGDRVGEPLRFSYADPTFSERVVGLIDAHADALNRGAA